MKGYYKDPEMTAAVMMKDGWFRTGDLCSMDSKKKGFRITIRGRSKNMILGSSGENIYPEDIEFVLNQHPFVADSLVVEGENSSLVAIVQLDEEKIAAEVQKRAAVAHSSHSIQSMTGAAYEAVGGAVSGAVSGFSGMINYKKEELLDEIKFFVNENVNRISRIDRVEMIEKFEKTASQKIKRYLYAIKNTIRGGRNAST
jgi:long-chain acyl-CoA synthetase